MAIPATMKNAMEKSSAAMTASPRQACTASRTKAATATPGRQRKLLGHRIERGGVAGVGAVNVRVGQRIQRRELQ